MVDPKGYLTDLQSLTPSAGGDIGYVLKLHSINLHAVYFRVFKQSFADRFRAYFMWCSLAHKLYQIHKRDISS